MSSKVKLVDDGKGGLSVVVVGEFNVGKVYEKKEDGSTILLPFGVTSVKGVLHNLLSLHIPVDGMKQWDEWLEEYTKLTVLETLGIETCPIMRRDDGLEGFKNGYEVVS